MKTIFISLFSFLIFILFFNSEALKSPQNGTPLQRALPQIQTELAQDLKNLTQEADSFKKLIEENKTTSFTQEEIEQYFQLRKTFKTVEFVIEYWDKQFYDQRMNGAPLPKLSPKDTSIRILKPKGLQVMDEILFGDITQDARKDVTQLIHLFCTDLKNFNKTFHPQKINQRQIFEALRYNIIREATLSVTGFDTPGSIHGLMDCENQLTSNQKYLSFFKDELNLLQQQDLFQNANLTYNKAIDFVKNNQDFDTFDRLYFINNFINPLYKTVKDIHFALNYETWNEVNKNHIHTLNYEADNLFDNNFLDKFSFVSQENDTLFSKRASLGRILFYDPLLSNNNQMACVSCHHPDKAFTDGRAKSLASDGKSFLKRNAMVLPYSVYAEKMFWDLRVSSLENQFEHVVTNELEFHTAYAEVVNKLKKSKAYQEKFKEAFGVKNAINTNTIDYALSAYIMTLGNFNSEFDKYMRKSTDLTPQEKAGFNLFAGKAACATCHFMPTFSGLVPPFYKESESEVLGITTSENQPWTLDKDLGRYAGKIKESADFYKHSMKTVTVRNAEKTAPYMHNGAFTSLENVMDFYNDGGGAGRGLQVQDQTLAPDALNLSDEEINQIIAFMKTLTDNDLPKAPHNKELPRDFENTAWNNRKIPLAE